MERKDELHCLQELATGQTNPVQTLTLFKIYVNIIPPSVPTYSKHPFHFRFICQNFVYISHFATMGPIPPPISTTIFGKNNDYTAPPSLQTFTSAFCFQTPLIYILPAACQTNSAVKLQCCVILHISVQQSFIAQWPSEKLQTLYMWQTKSCFSGTVCFILSN
jgi:hypothetical protein